MAMATTIARVRTCSTSTAGKAERPDSHQYALPFGKREGFSFAPAVIPVQKPRIMARRFHTLDVFTGHKLAGNPLAVVHDSDGLDTPAMQAIARELNLSETVFVLPPDDLVNTARIRIFTPAYELPFAGHPTVGAAVLLASLRAPELVRGSGVVVALEETIGLIKAEVRQTQGRAARAIFDLPKTPTIVPDPPRDPGLIATALGIDRQEILAGAHHPANASGGVPYTMVPLASLEALARAVSAPTPAFAAAFGGTSHPCCYLYVRTGANSWRTRMFAPLAGILEDPATGSAAAAFAATLMAFETPADGQHQHVLTQGVEMGRPSEIVLTLQVEGGNLASASIGGEAVIISEGVLHL
jgi:trans-2,3-dihydro-3-hydroxyanthranilate isomerase